MPYIDNNRKKSWPIVVVTPGKKYKGTILIAGMQEARTISILNSTKRKTDYATTNRAFQHDAFLELKDVTLFGQGKKYPHIYLRKSDIIFVYDEFTEMGSSFERKRFESMGGFEDKRTIEILTQCFSDQYYKITGNIFHIQQKFSSSEPFIPITDVRVINIVGLTKIQSLQETIVPFIALNKSYIESISFISDF